MRLEDHVRKAIWNYPTLYRSPTFELSRLLVLDHLFLTIGNGFEWTKDGYLSSDEWDEENDCWVSPRPYGEETFHKLPEGFFDWPLYQIEVTDSDLELFKREFGGYYYQRESTRKENPSVIFQADDIKTAEMLTRNYSVRYADAAKGRSERLVEGLVGIFVYEARAFKFPGVNADIHPYPISKYSAITEIYNGHTGSVVKPDWLSGCVDIAIATLEYYQDKTRYVHDWHHPTRTIRHDENRMKEAREKGDGDEDRLRELWGYRVGETAEQKCHRSWVEHRTKTIEFLEKFLNKFGD